MWRRDKVHLPAVPRCQAEAKHQAVFVIAEVLLPVGGSLLYQASVHDQHVVVNIITVVHHLHVLIREYSLRLQEVAVAVHVLIITVVHLTVAVALILHHQEVAVVVVL